MRDFARSYHLHTLWLSFGAVVIVSLAAVGVVYGIHDEAQRVAGSDILYPLIGVVVSGFSLRAAMLAGRQSRRLGLAWAVLAAAQISWLLGDLTWGILEIGLQTQPVSSLADVFYLLYYPAFLAGILLLPGEPITWPERIKRLLDVVIVIAASSLVFWLYWLSPRMASLEPADPFTTWVSVAYPVGDLVLVWAIASILLRPLRIQSRLPLVWLGLSALAGVVSDIVYVSQTMNGTYVSGSLIDLGWLVVMTTALLAAGFQCARLRSGQTFAAPRSVAALNAGWAGWLRLALPYLAILSACVLMMFGAPQNGRPNAVDQTWLRDNGIVVLIALVLVRQGLTLSENIRLSRALQSQLDHQLSVEQSLRVEIDERRRVELELLRSREQLAHDAVHDSLTHLPNRALLLDRLERVIEQTRHAPSTRYALLYLDVDEFKGVNDSLGHPTGDRLLVEIGLLLRRCVRERDTVARIGGDEFVILLEDMQSADGAQATADRILDRLTAGIEIDAQLVHVTASLGIVVNGSADQTADDILRDGDIALVKAKQSGKSCSVTFDESMRRQALARIHLENELRSALDAHELRLNYQPVLDVRLRRITGFEALLRWQHATLGSISPAEFIPIAEESGLIIPIGDMVLRTACRQMAEWNNRFKSTAPHTISVNLSTRQFRRETLVEEVAAALQETRLDPTLLNLEVTESALVDDAGAAVTTLNRLRALGVHLHIDDFGTGYSSLNYLYRFPADTLKIDRAFISRLQPKGRDHRMVSNIITMAHDLGLAVVAEGVETPEQGALLRSMGCEYIQGYAISRPLEVEDVTVMLERFYEVSAQLTRPLEMLNT